MVKSLKLFIALVTLGLITPFSIMAESPIETNFNIEDTEEDFELKDLEKELQRLLADIPEDISTTDEADTLVINSATPNDEAENLNIEYNEPMTEALKQELKAQPIDAKEEIILLDEDDGDNIFDQDEEELA